MTRKSLFSLMPFAMLALFIIPVNGSAQAMKSSAPFKVGTFAINDIPTVGLVVHDDQLIVENRREPSFKLGHRYTLAVGK